MDFLCSALLQNDQGSRMLWVMQVFKIEELTQLVDHLGQSRYETEVRLEKKLKSRSKRLAAAEDEIRRSEPSSPGSARSQSSFSSRATTLRQVSKIALGQ